MRRARAAPPRPCRAWSALGCGAVQRRRPADAPRRRGRLDYLRTGDELVVTRLSRMARSAKRHLTEIAALPDERGVDLAVLTQGIVTTTLVGRFLFHVSGSAVR